MSLNSSQSSDSSACFFALPDVSKKDSFLYQSTLATCIVTLLFSPITIAANGLILTAIWKNPSLRSPSYVLLAGLALTDLFTGLIVEPFFAARRISDEVVNRKKNFIAGIISDGFAYFSTALTVFVMTLMAVEKWLYMSRRSLLTVRRVSAIYSTYSLVSIAPIVGSMYLRLHGTKVLSLLAVSFFSLGAFCVGLTAFAYFKVFQIIRRHQNQVQTLQNTIDMKKYRKSFLTIVYIFLVFALSYSPYLCIIVIFPAIRNCGESYFATMNFCIIVVFLSSLLNPLLYYWRIKEIQDGVKRIVRKVLCKLNND